MLRVEWMWINSAVRDRSICRGGGGRVLDRGRDVAGDLDADLASGQGYHTLRNGDIQHAYEYRGDGQYSGVRILAGRRHVPSGHVMPAHPVVVLNFAFANGTSAPFDEAVLQGQDTLSGALTFSDAPFSTYGTSFVRAAQ